MQWLKKDLERLRRSDPVKYRYEIEFNTEALEHFKQKVLVA